MDRFAFFGKDQIAPNPRVIITEECDNCGAIYFLDQHPVAEMVSNLKTNKASSSLNRDSSDTERKKSRLDFDVYDDGDYLIM